MKSGMIRRYDSSLSSFARIGDGAIIIGCFFLSEYLYDISLRFEDLWIPLLTILIYNFFAETQDVYQSWRGVYLYKEAGAVLLSWGMTLAVVMFLDLMFKQGYWYQYTSMITWFLLVPFVVVSWHLLVRSALGMLRAKGFNTRRIAIVGATDLGLRLKDSFIENKYSGFVFDGFYDDRMCDKEGRRVSGSAAGTVGCTAELIERCSAGEVDAVYIALSLSAENRVKKIVSELADSTVSVYLVPDMFTFDLMNSRWMDYHGITAISIYDTPYAGLGQLVKRLEDVFLSLIILSLIALPMLLISIGIKATSKGPVIFKQKRYGRNGKEIEVWKFRSMTAMDNGGKVEQAKKGDARITPFGGFLRRTSLDELPQFLNVLGGSMSIVGPRPHAVAHNEEYRKQIQGYMMRHKIKPGITGLAQVNGFRGETDTLDKMEGRVHYDLQYIRNWSLWLDLKIVFMTVFKGFVHKNAY